jgi:glycosyltransferase involved in cell wall biosynthesis
VKPGHTLHMAFLAAGAPFNGDTPERRALGGSETACVQMARAMATRGHRVRVYCRCSRPGRYHGVQYFDSRDLVSHAGSERWDVVVISRDMGLLDLPIQAGLRVLWNHDLLEEPGELARRLPLLDICLVLSRYHAARFTARLPQCAGHLAVTRNGLDLEFMRRAAQGVKPVAGRMAYVSRPERGLKLLLEEIWPVLRERRPDLELNICGYQVDRSLLEPRLEAEYQQIDDLIASTPGVRALGSLAKGEYYGFLASCQALLYPCTFPEISCLAVLEAQALGRPVITSHGYALSESVLTPGFLVPGRPDSPEYCQRFAELALEQLDPASRAEALAADAARRVHEHYGWDSVAAEWEELFVSRLARRGQEDPAALAAGLVLSGDRSAAEHLLGRALQAPQEGAAPPDPKEELLVERLCAEAARLLAHGSLPRRVGVLAGDQGRTAAALAAGLAGVEVRDMDYPESRKADRGFGVVLIRDRLERERDPERLLDRAGSLAAPGGWLLICAATGAWPLVAPGHAGRWHDLGRRELTALLPGRRLEMDFIPYGLVGAGAERYFAGRLLAAVPAGGPPPGRLDADAPLRRVRPAPPALLEEVRRAGLI